MKISVLGLGIIGQAWARNLQADGLDIVTWNRTPKDFPGYTSDLENAIAGADLIIIVVADPPAVAAILDKVTPKLMPSQTIIQCSTISAMWTQKFARQVEATGAKFLEAPFTGSKPAAEARKTVFYIGGDAALLTKAQPTLQRLSQTILHIGPLGSASSLKLAMNMNIALVMQALSESLMYARREGISDEIFFQALGVNVSRSGLSDLKETKLKTGDFTPQFSLKHMHKDLNLVLESIKGESTKSDSPNKFSLPQLQALKAIYDQGVEAGLGDEDFSVLIQLLQNKT